MKRWCRCLEKEVTMVQDIGQAQNWCRVLKRSAEVLSMVSRSAEVVQSKCRMQQTQCRGAG